MPHCKQGWRLEVLDDYSLGHPSSRSTKPPNAVTYSYFLKKEEKEKEKEKDHGEQQPASTEKS